MSADTRRAEPQEAARGVSEAAELIASVAALLPEQTRTDLRRLLARRLTEFSPAEVRAQRLGLLLQLVAAGDGVAPSVAIYTRARKEALARGESWPTASVLTNAFGRWPRAVRAAMWLSQDGSARVAPATHHETRHVGYPPAEISAAVTACREALAGDGDEDWWPTERDYDDWRLLGRELARGAGNPMPRHPGRGAWRKKYGRWEEVIAAARRSSG